MYSPLGDSSRLACPGFLKKSLTSMSGASAATAGTAPAASSKATRRVLAERRSNSGLLDRGATAASGRAPSRIEDRPTLVASAGAATEFPVSFTRLEQGV